MIYRMMRDIEAALHAQLYPIDFAYEPTQPRQSYARRGFVEVLRDTSKGEKIGPPVGVRTNPRSVGVRYLGVQWTISAQSGVDGAMRNDHEHECDLYVDAIQCAIHEWGQVSGAGVIEFTEARYLSAAERDGADLVSDVAYLLRFYVPRGVVKRTYEGSARPTATVAAVDGATLAKLPGTNYQEVP